MTRASRRTRAALHAVLWAVVGIGSYVLGVRNAFGQRAEDSVLEAATYSTTAPFPLNLVSVWSVAIALVIIGVIALFAHGIRRAFVVTLVAGLAIVASQMLKQHVLTRPRLFELDLPNTFPSGHMTVFMALCAAVILAVPASIRALVALLTAVVLSAAGWQLLAYGWHRPSDVFGGIALGALVFSLICIVQPITANDDVFLGRTVSIGLTIIGTTLAIGAGVLLLVAAVASNAPMLLTAGEFGALGAAAIAARSLLRLSVR